MYRPFVILCHLKEVDRRVKSLLQERDVEKMDGEGVWGRGGMGGGGLAADLFTPVPLNTLVLFLLPVEENSHFIQIGARHLIVNTAQVWKNVEMLLFFMSHFLSSEVKVKHVSSHRQKKS